MALDKERIWAELDNYAQTLPPEDRQLNPSWLQEMLEQLLGEPVNHAYVLEWVARGRLKLV